MQLTLQESALNGLQEDELQLYQRPTERYQYCPMHRLPALASQEGMSEGCNPSAGGRAEPCSSCIHTPPEAECWSAEQAQRILGHGLRRQLEMASEREVDFMALLTRRRATSWVVYVPPRTKLSQPIRWIVENSWEHVIVLMGHGAEAELEIEHRAGAPLSSHVLDVRLDEHARLTISECETALSSYAFGALRAECKAEARLQWTGVTAGSDCVRWDLELHLLGEAAEVDVAGLWQLGEGRHAHAHVLMHHAAPQCTSNQLFKGLHQKGAVSSFSGLIDVERIAQKTLAYQLHQSLLLHPSARSHSKPSLDIRADDVKASHGSTTGHLESETLYYLQSRGIPKVQAQQMLAQAFLAPVLTRLPLHWQLRMQEGSA